MWTFTLCNKYSWTRQGNAFCETRWCEDNNHSHMFRITTCPLSQDIRPPCPPKCLLYITERAIQLSNLFPCVKWEKSTKSVWFSTGEHCLCPSLHLPVLVQDGWRHKDAQCKVFTYRVTCIYCIQHMSLFCISALADQWRADCVLDKGGEVQHTLWMNKAWGVEGALDCFSRWSWRWSETTFSLLALLSEGRWMGQHRIWCHVDVARLHAAQRNAVITQPESDPPEENLLMQIKVFKLFYCCCAEDCRRT